jgi:molybdopterin molybdotransferase
MTSVAEASERILARIGALSEEAVATGNAGGRVLSGDVVAPIDSPPWDNSSMDGYAVQSNDLRGGLPVSLAVIEEIPAGAIPSRALLRGEAARVMTGAPVPEGADCVIRREDTDDGRDIVTIRALRDLGKNIRRKGEDFRAGDRMFSAGETLSVAHLGALASAGLKAVNVHRRPRVAIISSGDELIELSDFSSAQAGRKIISSNSVTLSALVRDAGGEPIDLGIASDSENSIRGKLDQARDADLIITTAGISVGDHDHVRSAFASLGGVLEFWKVRMRPGAPLAFGILGHTPWIGLSGNPVSAIVTFEIFVRPAVRKMLGFRLLFPQTVPARVGHSITLGAPLMHFLRVTIDRSTNGEYVANLAGSQSSGVLTAMARSNALLILPGDHLEIDRGEIHRALPLGESFHSAARLVLE